MRTLVALISVLLLTLVARAQTAASQSAPLPDSRMLRTFDFEETKLGNFESRPMYWAKVIGKGYPAYSEGRFDHTVFRSPNTSFKLETQGGSVAYRLMPPPDKRIPIHPDSDYYILAFVRTSQLQHARADLAAWFADDQGKLLPSTELHSQPYTPDANSKDSDTWRVLYIFMPGPEKDAKGEQAQARSLVLQVGLMQPQQLGAISGAGDGGEGDTKNAVVTGADSNLGRFSIYQQDIKGAVWFDDIVVFQLPRVAVRVPSTVVGGVFGSGQKVDLDLIVSDLGATANHLDVRLKVADPEGLVMASEQWAAATSAENAWTHRFSHAPLPAGLYTATLEVAQAEAANTNTGQPGSGRALIARRQTQFLCLPPASSTGLDRAAPEFGLGLGASSDSRAIPLADASPIWSMLLRQTGAGLAQLPAWRRDMSEDAISRRDQGLDALLASLQRYDIRTIGAISEIPATLATRLPATISDKQSILSLMSADAAVWRPYLSFTLTRYSNRIDFWELGSPDVSFSGELASAGSRIPDLAERYTRLYERTYGEISGLLNRPQVLIPWNALFEFDPKEYPHAVLDLRLPSIIKPAQLPAYIENFRQAQRPAGTQPAGAPPLNQTPIFAHIDPLEEGRYSHADRLADFAQRIIFARLCEPTAILYDPGARGPRGGPRSEANPDELVLVYRTLVRAIGNAKYIGEVPMASGVRAFLFDNRGSGTLILWNEASGKAEVGLDLPLGATPRLTDLLGNQRMPTVDGATGFTHIVASAIPVVLDQLDARPLQLKTSFALATSTLPAGVGEVRTQVLLKNPYAETIGGTLRLEPPPGWATDPSTMSISIAAGATVQLPLLIRYPFTETAGPKEFRGELNLDQGLTVTQQQLRLSYPLAITSDQVQLEGFSQMLPNGDIVIQQMITNISNAPLNAQAYALLPNYPRQQHYVVALPAGQTSIKRFIFPASTFVHEGQQGTAGPEEIAKALAGSTATLGLRQNTGQTLLTKTIPLE